MRLAQRCRHRLILMVTVLTLVSKVSIGTDADNISSFLDAEFDNDGISENVEGITDTDMVELNC